MDSPKNHIWGPALWAILHYSAERIGLPLKKLQGEESRIWLNLLTSLRYSLPCPQCKRHYSEYIAARPPTAFSQPAIREWLYQLHCDVNARLGKDNITIEQLSEIYSKPFQFTKYSRIVAEHMTYALRIGVCIRTDIQRTLRCLEEVRRFYDFF